MNKDLENKDDYIGSLKKHLNYSIEIGSQPALTIPDKVLIIKALSALQQPETSVEVGYEIHDYYFKNKCTAPALILYLMDNYIILKRQQE